MSDSSLPHKTNETSESIEAFLTQANQLPQRIGSERRQEGKLIFAIDATASRQASWDRACQLQSQMFLAGSHAGNLSVQLCYYRGFQEFFASEWYDDTTAMLRNMTSVRCLGGHTQISRLLRHCRDTQRHTDVKAVVFIGDAVEENIDRLCQQAGELGLLGLPLFLFQEGRDHRVSQAFQQMATLSGGAFARFDEASAATLAGLLSAVASFACGGYDALQKLGSAAARLLIEQLPRT